MRNLLFFIDKISSWVGQLFSWLIVILTFLITWEVFSRYALNSPNPWSFDLMIMAYGTAFMMACLLYTSPSPRDQRGSRMPSSA